MASGRFVRIVARGRRSGEPRAVTVGFAEVEEKVAEREDEAGSPASIVVAAGAPDSAWARNLLAEPACQATVGERSFDAVAEPLAGAEHAAAIRALILRYGTPAESLGHGPSFRLVPVLSRANG